MKSKVAWPKLSTESLRALLGSDLKQKDSSMLSPQRGFALLEILIGGFLLAIAAVGLAFMFSEAQSYAVAGGDDRVALALAQEKIEHVRSLGFNCIPAPITSPAANTVIACTSSNNCDPGCTDNTDTQAARTYNETPLGRYSSRFTRVRCADATGLTPGLAGCDSAKIITVDITPNMRQARGVRVETVVMQHD
jgi:type II secretory pathway pseudopilin PulG